MYYIMKDISLSFKIWTNRGLPDAWANFHEGGPSPVERLPERVKVGKGRI